LTQAKIICLTPVKNEAWILHRFLQCASLWADHIIIADQGSTDGSREIALSYPKVTLIKNHSNDFSETERQQLLITEARKISGKRLLIALDADEIFTANIINSKEWKSIISSPQGSVFGFQWVNLRPDMKTCWIPEYYFPWAYMDDNSQHEHSQKIHNHRLPVTAKNKIIDINHNRSFTIKRAIEIR